VIYRPRQILSIPDGFSQQEELLYAFIEELKEAQG
jgi:hypothetical protein